MAFGYDKDMLRRYAAVVVWEIAMEAMRGARNAASRDAHARITIVGAGNALRHQIYDDWARVHGRNDVNRATQRERRWHPDSHCPQDRDQFERSWRPLARVVTRQGKVVIELSRQGLEDGDTDN